MENNFKNQLSAEKKEIIEFIIQFLNEQENQFRNQKLHQKIFNELKEFVTSGKTARGSIFMMTHRLLNHNNKEEALKIAAALELIHSGLLIHDDIIDQDQKRRGRNSTWFQFQEKAIQENKKNAELYGKSLAICTANICYYLANTLLETLEQSEQIKKIINQEIIMVNFAEMLDVDIATQQKAVKLEEIINMYQYKTARYTFSLPLMLASTFNKKNESLTKQLEKIGESLGLIFQIKDDEIGLFTHEEKSGKVFASDIKEGKKTIFYYFLMKNLEDKKDKTEFEKLFGKENLSQKEVIYIQELFKKHAIEETNKILEQLEKLATIEIKKIENKYLQKLIEEILDFNLNRDF